MMRAVDEVLDEIGAGDKPTLLVLNKVDELDDGRAPDGGRRATATRCWSRRSTGEGHARSCGSGSSARSALGWSAVELLVPVRPRRGAVASCTTWPATSSARTPARACG